MPKQLARIHHYKGTAKEVGYAFGQALGERMAKNIDSFIKNAGLHGDIDFAKLKNESLSWMQSLPLRYQEEFEGMALGSGVSLQRLAEWSFVSNCFKTGCSSFVLLKDQNAWIGRNNDFWQMDLWGYVNIREITGRIPSMIFGTEAELFSGTGINKEKLWLHYNYLPVKDAPNTNYPTFQPYVLLVEMLETCSNLSEVESAISTTHRDGGMMLFAVDGKSNEVSIYECNCSEFRQRKMTTNFFIGTNHYLTDLGTHFKYEDSANSKKRYNRLKKLLEELSHTNDNPNFTNMLIEILKDSDVEAKEKNYGTVYANVVCPAGKYLKYTFGGFPAASTGNWQNIDWPW